MSTFCTCAQALCRSTNPRQHALGVAAARAIKPPESNAAAAAAFALLTLVADTREGDGVICSCACASTAALLNLEAHTNPKQQKGKNLVLTALRQDVLLPKAIQGMGMLLRRYSVATNTRQLIFPSEVSSSMYEHFNISYKFIAQDE